MKAPLLKAYLKYIYKALLIELVVFSVLCYFNKDFKIYLILFAFSLIGGYFKYETKLAEIKKLQDKGLTEEDIHNINFVKKWEETREKGIWRYCIIDGGIISGAYLWLIVSILLIATSIVKLQTLVDAPGNMFGFIGYNYIAGAIIGVIIHRALWPYNERRFKRLTDPLLINH